MIELDDRDMREALDRIARTPDGLILYRYLQKILCEILPASAPECALPRHEGRRSFASELMSLMAEGIDGGRAGSESARPIALGKRDTAEPRRRVSARQWLRDNPAVWPGATEDSEPAGSDAT